MLWTDKYRPQTLDEVVGNNKEKKIIQDWVESWKKDGYYEILAYSDNESDHSELYRMAKQKDARYIRSFLSEGVTTIE